ncbi:hypothetical protein [Nocardia vinacea]|uniref:hypothetical protein n=1 Tax=Nocardia vinacea TaxID=96468 RepID=UPI0002DAC686|nr:hypothetical protein [Nocardia vinacea]
MTSTESQSFLDAITHISWQLDAGLHDQARDEFERALTELASPTDLDRLVRLADTFTNSPYVIARASLRSLWRRSDPELRAWLDTFVTRTDPGLHRPVEDQPRWIATVPLVAAETSARRLLARDPNKTRSATPSTATAIAAKRAWRRPEHIEAIKSKRRPVSEPRVVTDYIRTRFLLDTDPAFQPSVWDRNYVRQVADQVLAERDRAGARTREDFDADEIARTRTGLDIRDDDRPAFQANGNGLDYDHTTLAPLQGWVCVYCFGERACSDHFRTNTTGHRISDDGLCQHCRDHDRAGIAALPADFTLADEVAAYCQYLTDHYPAAAPAVLDALQQRSTRIERGLVMAFLDRDPTTIHTGRTYRDADSSAVARRALLLVHPPPRDRHRRPLRRMPTPLPHRRLTRVPLPRPAGDGGSSDHRSAAVSTPVADRPATVTPDRSETARVRRWRLTQTGRAATQDQLPTDPSPQTNPDTLPTIRITHNPSPTPPTTTTLLIINVPSPRLISLPPSTPLASEDNDLVTTWGFA